MTVPEGGGSQGPATDSRNVPVIDPTRNVMDLVTAAGKRQDDLRELTASHMHEMAVMRASYEEKLRVQEASRIDSIREVDANAVARAAEVGATQASILAAQVATSAETLRGQVAAAAIAAAGALSTALEPIQRSIDDLRRAQYEQQGQKVASTENRGTNQWALAFAISVILTLASLISLIIFVTTKK
ncbi:MAG: hypothetical protein NVSMB4_00450 [Acidimicrobiales bacterium]